MALFQRSHKNSLPMAKIAVFLVGTTAAIVVLTRFAVPSSISALSSTVPRLWSSVRFFLVPPYLFITVHLIIVAIWKLSDQRLHKNPKDKLSNSVKLVDHNVTPSKTVLPEIPIESEAVTPISGSKSGESCVTTESDENSVVSSRFESKKVEDEAIDLEDTWQTIVMKKSATWERSSEMAVVETEVAGEGVVRRSMTFEEASPVPEANDELNRRFEAFIKKNYDQIRSY